MARVKAHSRVGVATVSVSHRKNNSERLTPSSSSGCCGVHEPSSLRRTSWNASRRARFIGVGAFATLFVAFSSSSRITDVSTSRSSSERGRRRRSCRSSRSAAVFQARAAFSGEAVRFASARICSTRKATACARRRASRVRRAKRNEPLSLPNERAETERDGFAPIEDTSATHDAQSEDHHGIQSPAFSRFLQQSGRGTDAR